MTALDRQPDGTVTLDPCSMCGAAARHAYRVDRDAVTSVLSKLDRPQLVLALLGFEMARSVAMELVCADGQVYTDVAAVRARRQALVAAAALTPDANNLPDATETT